jgi:hypothetical protein
VNSDRRRRGGTYCGQGHGGFDPSSGSAALIERLFRGSIKISPDLIEHICSEELRWSRATSQARSAEKIVWRVLTRTRVLLLRSSVWKGQAIDLTRLPLDLQHTLDDAPYVSEVTVISHRER